MRSRRPEGSAPRVWGIGRLRSREPAALVPLSPPVSTVGPPSVEWPSGPAVHSERCACVSIQWKKKVSFLVSVFGWYLGAKIRGGVLMEGFHCIIWHGLLIYTKDRAMRCTHYAALTLTLNTPASCTVSDRNVPELRRAISE